MPGLAVDSADYELLWPRELFARELAAVRAIRRPADRNIRVERLLEEAFLGDTPVQDFRTFNTWRSDEPWETPRPEYVDELLAQVSKLREHGAPRPYWSTRRGVAPQEAPPRSIQQLQLDFAGLVRSLLRDGYFDRELPKVCVDDHDSVEVDPNDVLFERLGVPDLWPLDPDQWDEDTFYDLVEVFHDLAARPRTRRYHDYRGCGWHVGDFATEIGRALYRSRVNQLLASGGIELRLAEVGEDVGRLVRLVDDARSDLLERALRTPEPDTRGRVEHAIALFRGRMATEHDKRSAIVALATVLEDRKGLLKTTLFTDDESALFHIANRFDLRHRNDKQHTDYDPAFRDWVFWWYLATIELTDRLLARQEDGEATA